MEFEEGALELFRKIIKKRVEEMDDREILKHAPILVKGHCDLISFSRIVSLEKSQGYSEKLQNLSEW